VNQTTRGRRGAGAIPFGAFVEELLTLYQPPLRALKTRDRMRHTLRVVAGLVGPGGSTADLVPELVARFIRERPAGEASITTHTLLSYLRTACNYAKTRGYLRSSPFEYRRDWVSRRVEPRKRHHGLAEIARVLETMRAEVEARQGWARWRARRLHALASTVAYTGMRASEAIYLRVGDLVLDDRMIVIVPHEARALKTERAAQPVPMPRALAEVLDEWLSHRAGPLASGPGGPAEGCPYAFPNATFSNAWSGGRHGRKAVDAMKQAGRRAGVEGFTFQSLRHSFATHAETAWGLSPATIQRVLRHTSLSTQVHYRHADAENLRRAVEGVAFGPAPGPAGTGA